MIQIKTPYTNLKLITVYLFVGLCVFVFMYMKTREEKNEKNEDRSKRVLEGGDRERGGGGRGGRGRIMISFSNINYFRK